LYETVKPLKRGLYGKVDRIGLSGTNLTFNEPTKKQPESRKLAAADHKSAANSLIDWLEKQIDFKSVKGVGHRVVHGMKHTEPEIVTKKLLDELRRISPNDPDHLPREIELIEVFRQRHPKLPQVACFDTAFHQTMPRVAKLLPIPRRFDAKGIQRYGFHGLSYSYLMEELARLGDPAAKKGRVILAHLGNGASMAAVRDGKSIDTSMGFTPTAGLVMSTRSGDLDPGLAPYLARTEQMTTNNFTKWSTTSRDCSAFRKPVPTCAICSTMKKRMCARRKPWRCFVIRRKSGSALTPPRSVDWTRSSSPAASAKMRQPSARASVKG
jgi:acetate kinase